MTKPDRDHDGRPCGIGPEICAKLFAAGLPAPALVVGDAGLLRRTAKTLGLDISVREIADAADAAGAPGELAVLSVGALPGDLPIGKVDARAGRASYDYVVTAIDPRPGRRGRRDRHGADRQGGAEGRRHRLSRTHGDPGGEVRHDRLRDDAGERRIALDARHHSRVAGRRHQAGQEGPGLADDPASRSGLCRDLRHRAAAHRRGRPQSACRRRRHVLGARTSTKLRRRSRPPATPASKPADPGRAIRSSCGRAGASSTSSWRSITTRASSP